MTKATLHGLTAALAIVAAPTSQACESWGGFYTGTTWSWSSRGAGRPAPPHRSGRADFPHPAL